MKKALTLIVCVLFALGLNAQNEQHLYLHHSGAVIYNDAVHNINDITFHGTPASAVVNGTNGPTSFPVTMIDSITFGIEEAPSGDIVRIVYNGNSVEITNPFSNEGVSVSNNQADVVVSSSKANVIYSLSGTTSNGSITFMSSKDFSLILDNANLSSASKAVIDIASETNVTIELNGTSTLSDGSNGAQKAAICSAGNLTFTKADGTLNINGNTKHGIFAEGNLIVSGGKIIINDAQSDGLHIDSFTQTNGEISILHSGSDGIDSSTDINIFGGSISINSTGDDTKGLNASETVSISGGTVEITSSGYDSKAIKCDDLVELSMPSEPECKMLISPLVWVKESTCRPSLWASLMMIFPPETIRFPSAKMPCLVLPLMFSVPSPLVKVRSPAEQIAAFCAPLLPSERVEMPFNSMVAFVSDAMSMTALLVLERLALSRKRSKSLLLIKEIEPLLVVPDNE